MSSPNLLMLVCALCAVVVRGAHFKDTFEDLSRWSTPSSDKDESTRGTFELSSGQWWGSQEGGKGMRTTPDSRFFTTYTELDSDFSTADQPLVLQFSVKHEQKMDCGGGYIKVLPASSADAMPAFSGDTPYSIMFGPDICGHGTKRVHVIFTHNGVNHLIEKDVPCETDQLTHVYTLVVNPDKSYQVLIDLKEVAAGSLFEDWGMIPKKRVKDPDAVKPEDWVDDPSMRDTSAVQPDDWEETPATIPDPSAVQPEDWDAEEDGEWEAPTMPNPDYRGPWSAPLIPNPDYKGPWEAPMIDNPEYKEDASVGVYTDLRFLGFELWQVKSGTIFDNIILTNSLEEAKEFAESTWGAEREGEKAMFNTAEEERMAEARAAQEASGGGGDDPYAGMDMGDLEAMMGAMGGAGGMEGMGMGGVDPYGDDDYEDVDEADSDAEYEHDEL